MNKNTISTINSLDVSGICTLCGKKSECKCDRCGDFYCSEDCQKKDWPKHRYICLPMPKLVKVGQNLASESTRSQVASNNAKSSPSSSLAKVGQNHSSEGTHSQLSSKNAEFSTRCSTIPNGSCVLLTSIKSSNQCYIRSMSPSIVAEYEKVLSTINESGKTSPPLCGKLAPKSLALTTRNGKWYRVEILGIVKDNTYRVYFIDSGEISNRSIKEFRKMDHSLLNIPCFIQGVKLKGITSSCNLKLLHKYVNKEYKVVFDETKKNEFSVELYKWGSPVLLNSLIQDLTKNKDGAKDNDVTDVLSVSSSSCDVALDKNGVCDKKDHNTKTSEDINHTANKMQTNLKDGISAKNVNSKISSANTLNGSVATKPENKSKNSEPRQILTACLNPPFEIIPLNENECNGKIMIMDCSYIESGYIGCLSDKYVDNLKAVTKFLSEYETGDQSYKPKFNEYCLANYEQEWYRAKVVEVLSENRFLVVYIDFTNESELTSESIRRYPMSLTLPCCTSLCSIEGLPEDISVKQKEFLESICVPFQLLNIESVRVKKNITYVKSNMLLDKMCEAKLL